MKFKTNQCLFDFENIKNKIRFVAQAFIFCYDQLLSPSGGASASYSGGGSVVMAGVAHPIITESQSSALHTASVAHFRRGEGRSTMMRAFVGIDILFD